MSSDFGVNPFFSAHAVGPFGPTGQGPTSREVTTTAIQREEHTAASVAANKRYNKLNIVSRWTTLE